MPSSVINRPHGTIVVRPIPAQDDSFKFVNCSVLSEWPRQLPGVILRFILYIYIHIYYLEERKKMCVDVSVQLVC